MLVLSRKKGEKIHIGEDIILTITDIDCNCVRIGIKAPRDVKIYREELLPTAPPKATTPPETEATQ